MSSNFSLYHTIINLILILTHIVLNSYSLSVGFYQIPALMGMLHLIWKKYYGQFGLGLDQAAQIGPLLGIMYFVFHSSSYPDNVWNILWLASFVLEFLFAFHKLEPVYKNDTAFFLVFAGYAVFNNPSALVYLDAIYLRVIGAVIGYGLLVAGPRVADNSGFIWPCTISRMRYAYFILLPGGYVFLFIFYFQWAVIKNTILMMNLFYPVAWSIYLWYRIQMKNRVMTIYLGIGISFAFFIPVALNIKTSIPLIPFIAILLLLLGFIITLCLHTRFNLIYFWLKFGFSFLFGLINYLMQINYDEMLLGSLINFVAFLGLTLGSIIKDYTDWRYLEKLQPSVLFMMPLKMLAVSIISAAYYYTPNLNLYYGIEICVTIVIGEIIKEISYQFRRSLPQYILLLITAVSLGLNFISGLIFWRILVVTIGVAILNLLEIYSIYKNLKDDIVQAVIQEEILEEKRKDLHALHDKKMIMLNFYYLDGKMFSMQCSELNSGMTLKNLIEVSESYVNLRFDLIFNNKIVEENESLAAQKIKNGSNIAIVFVSSIFNEQPVHYDYITDMKLPSKKIK